MTHRGSRSQRARKKRIPREIIYISRKIALNYAVEDDERDEITNVLTPDQMLTKLKAEWPTEIAQCVPDFYERGLVLCSGIGRGALNLKPDFVDCFKTSSGGEK